MIKVVNKSISSNDKELPFVSVIIPVCNDANRLSNCLSALEKQTYPYQSFEVVVVDNASSEDNRPVFEEDNHVKLLCEYRPGSYAARNLGIQHSKSEVLVFTDSDCVPASDWIEKGVTQLINTVNCGIIGGRIEFFYRDHSNPTVVEIYDSIKFMQQERCIEKGKFSVTANMFTFKSIFDKVGLFNASMKSGGDVEWATGFMKAATVLLTTRLQLSFIQREMDSNRFTRKPSELREDSVSLNMVD